MLYVSALDVHGSRCGIDVDIMQHVASGRECPAEPTRTTMIVGQEIHDRRSVKDWWQVVDRATDATIQPVGQRQNLIVSQCEQ